MPRPIISREELHRRIFGSADATSFFDFLAKAWESKPGQDALKKMAEKDPVAWASFFKSMYTLSGYAGTPETRIQINVFENPTFVTFQQRLLIKLERNPEAKQLVLEALREVREEQEHAEQERETA